MTRLLQKVGPALVALALVVSACSDDGDGSGAERRDAASSTTAAPTGTADSTDTADPEEKDSPSDEDLAIADAAVLQLSDFPSSWDEKAIQDDGNDEIVDRVAACMEVAPSEIRGGSATAESATFVSPGDHEVSNTVAVLETEDDAAARFELVSSTEYQNCLRDEIAQLLRDRASGNLTLGEPTIQQASPDGLGDEATVLRVTMSFETDGVDLNAYQDVVIVRIGRAAVTVSSFSALNPFDSSALAAYTRIVVDRLDDALNPGG